MIIIKIIIIKSNPISFVLFNLKSKFCYQTPILLSSEKIRENEYQLYMQQIYEKFYLIHLNNNNIINIYRLSNIKKIKLQEK